MEASVKLESLLAKSKEPLSFVELEVEAFGLYALPDAWIHEAETQELNYVLKIAGTEFSNGRFAKRELTEEEIKAMEESKKSKKDQPKKGQAQAPEPTPEELEALERERKAKLEEQRRREEEWESLDEETKFYITMEDIYKNPCIVWEKDQGHTEARRFKTYSQKVIKSEESLVEFEEFVEDAKGFYMDVFKIPKPVEEDPKKKKGKTVEEVKPVHARAWVNLNMLTRPGCSSTNVRCRIEDLEGAEEKHFTGATYVYLRISVNPPITPPLDGQVKVKVSDLIPPKPPLPKFMPSKNVTHDFRRQIKLAVKAIGAEYHNMFSDQLDLETRKYAVSQQRELREKRKEQFLYEFNISGKAQVLKNKLKKSIVKIALEKYKKSGSLKGLSYTDKDKFFSQLYAYLVQEMQGSVDEVMQEKRETLHEDLIIPKDLAAREKEQMLAISLKEPVDDKLQRLIWECELTDDLVRAEELFRERIVRDNRNSNIWLDYARFSLRNGDLSRAEECLREVISLTATDATVDQLNLLGALFIQRGRYHEAAVYLQSALDKDFFNVVSNMLTSILYKLSGNTGLQKKYLAISKRLVMRHLGLLPPKRGAKSSTNSSLEGAFFRVDSSASDQLKALTQDQIDDMHYVLIDFLIREKFLNLAEKVIQEIVNKQSSMGRYSFYTASIRYWYKDYPRSEEILQQLLNAEPRHEQAWVLRGHCLYKIGNGFDAEECYLKAIRYATKSKAAKNQDVLVRLGNLYLKRRAWNDAKLVFMRVCEESGLALGWAGLGIACLNLKEYGEAEDALTQANIMDDQNGYIWGNLALLCLKTTSSPPGRFIQARQCLQSAFRYNLKDSLLISQLASIFKEKFESEGPLPSIDRSDYLEVLSYLMNSGV